jgi:hypothetical protein
VFAELQTFKKLDAVLKYCSPTVHVDGSEASFRAGMVWPALPKSIVAAGAATSPPELTWDRSCGAAHAPQIVTMNAHLRV